MNSVRSGRSLSEALKDKAQWQHLRTIGQGGECASSERPAAASGQADKTGLSPETDKAMEAMKDLMAKMNERQEKDLKSIREDISRQKAGGGGRGGNRGGAGAKRDHPGGGGDGGAWSAGGGWKRRRGPRGY